MRKIIAVVLLICLLSATISAGAIIAPEDAAPVIPVESVVSKTAEFYIKASELPTEVLSVFSAQGARIEDDTVIEVLPLDDSEGKAICVTNVVDNNAVERDVFLPFSEDENGELAVDNSMADALASEELSIRNASFPIGSWVDSYMVHATGIAYLYLDGNHAYYRPYQCSFYYETFTNVNVQRIRVEYATYGVLYSYPDYELEEETSEHVVAVDRELPNEAVPYYATNPMRSDRVLMTESGTPFSGHSFTFMCYVNGELETYTVPGILQDLP